MTPQEHIHTYQAAVTGPVPQPNPLDGFYIIETDNVPARSWGLAVGSTLYIHPRDLALLSARVWAATEARRVVRTGLSPVLTWLSACGVKAADPQAADLTTAVEAGARAHFDRIQKARRDAGRLNDDGTPIRWEQLRPIDQFAFREFVVPIVAAALATVPGGGE